MSEAEYEYQYWLVHHDKFESQNKYEQDYFRADNEEFEDPTWTTREGVVILIQDMTDDHLRNTILMLQRNAERKLRNEVFHGIRPQGEVALGAYEEMMAEIIEKDPDELAEYYYGPKYAQLRREAENRGWKVPLLL